jgi:hypothetical protein
MSFRSRDTNQEPFPHRSSSPFHFHFHLKGNSFSEDILYMNFKTKYTKCASLPTVLFSYIGNLFNILKQDILKLGLICPLYTQYIEYSKVK